jgi:hypothetical protein
VKPLFGRCQGPLYGNLTVVGDNEEGPGHDDEELVASFMGVPAPSDTHLKVKKMKLAADFERELLSRLGESQGAAWISPHRQLDKLTGNSHRGPTTRALRYSP